MKHVICILLLAFMASCAGNEMIEEVVTDSSSVRTRSVGTGVYSNSWNILNATFINKRIKLFVLNTSFIACFI